LSEFLLHVGMTKSGTKTLQDLFATHSQVYALGKMKRNNVSGGFRSEEVRALLSPLLFESPEHDIDLPELQRQYRELILPQAAGKQVCVASWEGLANRPPVKFAARIERVRAVVGPCKILFTLRNPVKWAASWYLQTMENNFIRRSAERRFKGRPYLDFDVWFDERINERKTVERVFCCPDNIRDTAELLGADSVGVFLLEELAVDPEKYFTRLARFMGVDSAEAIQLARNSHHNSRLLDAEFEYIREVGSDQARSKAWEEQSPTERSAAMKAHVEASVDRTSLARVDVPESISKQIIEANMSGNRWIQSELGIELERYGYQV